jgi:hypothetical protein
MGLPLNLMQPIFQPRGGYLAFIGEYRREAAGRAIAIAPYLASPLRFAAKVDRDDEAYLSGDDRTFAGMSRRKFHR